MASWGLSDSLAGRTWGLEKRILHSYCSASLLPSWSALLDLTWHHLPSSRLYAHLVWKLLGAQTE